MKSEHRSERLIFVNIFEKIGCVLDINLQERRIVLKPIADGIHYDLVMKNILVI